MKKKVLVLFAVLALFATSGAFAERAQANWVYGQIGLIHGGLGYERILTPQISVGGEAYWNMLFFFWNGLAFEAYGKFYPWSGNFYLKLGLGYGTVTGFSDNDSFSVRAGLAIDPGIGWKIDVGEPGGFFIEPKVGVLIVIGKNSYDTGWTGTIDTGVGVGTNFVVAFAMGYCW
jgi:hypothetical protein